MHQGVQMANRGELFEAFGQEKPLSAWSKEYRVPVNTLYGRMKRMRWTLEQALTYQGARAPQRPRKKTLGTYDDPAYDRGEYDCMEWFSGQLSPYGYRLYRLADRPESLYDEHAEF